MTVLDGDDVGDDDDDDSAKLALSHSLALAQSRALPLSHSRSLFLSHAHTLPRLHSPTVPLFHSPTFPHSHSPILALSHSPTFPRGGRCVPTVFGHIQYAVSFLFSSFVSRIAVDSICHLPLDSFGLLVVSLGE